MTQTESAEEKEKKIKDVYRIKLPVIGKKNDEEIKVESEIVSSKYANPKEF